MKRKKYTLLLFITLIIIATVGLQLHWNIKNYEQNKLRLISEVQAAFDNSIESYYASNTKSNVMTFLNRADSIPKDSLRVSRRMRGNMDIIQISGDKKMVALMRDSLRKRGIEMPHPERKKLTYVISDSQKPVPDLSSVPPSQISRIQLMKDHRIAGLKDFTNRLIVSMVRDSIDFKKLDSTLQRELKRKNILVGYGIEHLKSDTVYERFQKNKSVLPLHTFSKSTFLPPDQKLKLNFTNPTLLLLQRSLAEILLSFLLSLAIIGCLLYLLRTINRQKKIDEIKNDLISNITHEFKTPITTVATAIEGARNFNAANDIEKTNRYLDISGQQLKKLEIMVEKLLETASIDTDKLLLQPERINVVSLLKDLTNKHRMISPEKKITLESNMEQLFITVDPFHFENAVSNLIDNALKYGGDTIDIRLDYSQKKLSIAVQDNGPGIEKSQQGKIFDKFYRIPKGNRHDVKGFGIGLYYSRKIIEKHGGALELASGTNRTIFKISLPDGA